MDSLHSRGIIPSKESVKEPRPGIKPPSQRQRPVLALDGTRRDCEISHRGRQMILRSKRDSLGTVQE
jgi:hypothetical protein